MEKPQSQSEIGIYWDPRQQIFDESWGQLDIGMKERLILFNLLMRNLVLFDDVEPVGLFKICSLRVEKYGDNNMLINDIQTELTLLVAGLRKQAFGKWGVRRTEDRELLNWIWSCV